MSEAFSAQRLRLRALQFPIPSKRPAHSLPLGRSNPEPGTSQKRYGSAAATSYCALHYTVLKKYPIWKKERSSYCWKPQFCKVSHTCFPLNKPSNAADFDKTGSWLENACLSDSWHPAPTFPCSCSTSSWPKAYLAATKNAFPLLPSSSQPRSLERLLGTWTARQATVSYPTA